MTDRLEKLEKELAAVRPAALPRDLERRIGREIESPDDTHWADRKLRSAMAMGAMAACVIVSVLLRGGAMNVPAAPQPMVVQATSISVGYPLLMAGANSNGLDELK